MDNRSDRRLYINFVRSTANLTNSDAITEVNASNGIDTQTDCQSASEIYEQVLSLPSTSAENHFQPVLLHKVSNVSTAQSNHTSSSLPPLKNTDIFKFCQHGMLKECKRWISSGFDVNQLDAYHWTPLMVASCSGHSAIVDLLLNSGANCDITCQNGKSALDLARKLGHKQVIKLISEHRHPPEPTNRISKESTQNYVLSLSPFECPSCGRITDMDRTAHELSISHQLNSGQFSSAETRSLGNFAHINRNFKGYKLLRQEGWNGITGLGAREDGRRYPIEVKKKPDRACIGLPQNSESRLTQAAAEPNGRQKLKHRLQHEEQQKRKLETEFRRSFR